MKLLVNREPELKVIDESFKALLGREERLLRTPIIEVQGVGGIGKTSLLKEIEQRCQNEHPPEIWIDINQSALDTLNNPIKPIEACNFIFEWPHSYPLAMKASVQAEQDESDPRTPRQQDVKQNQSPVAAMEEDSSLHSSVAPSAIKHTLLHPDTNILDESILLLVTATWGETNAVLQAFYKLLNLKHIPQQKVGKVYFELGVVNSTRVFLVQSGMGSYGLDGSLLTVYEAIQQIKPSCIIMTGIAFGVNPRKQRFGDILVAENVVDYESVRLGIAPDGTHETIW